MGVTKWLRWARIYNERDWTGMESWASQTSDVFKVGPELHESLLVRVIIRVLSRTV